MCLIKYDTFIFYIKNKFKKIKTKNHFKKTLICTHKKRFKIKEKNPKKLMKTTSLSNTYQSKKNTNILKQK
jgi:hypothetical protein